MRVKASVIKKYEVIYGNRDEISEYFYGFRKQWNDVKHRIEENRFRSMGEKVAALKGGRRSPARMQR